MRIEVALTVTKFMQVTGIMPLQIGSPNASLSRSANGNPDSRAVNRRYRMPQAC